MAVLVSYASRSGAAREIADAVAGELVAAGYDVVVRPCGKAPAAYDYQAVVVGSAIYAGQWLKQATDYLAHHAPDLAERPTYLFEAGPATSADTESTRAHTPRAVRNLAEGIGAVAPRLFPGRPSGGPLRAATRRYRFTDHGGEHDHWAAVHEWARYLVTDLQRRGVTPARPPVETG